jgi:oxygen-independent coproporphyrinogen-3 oxidase
MLISPSEILSPARVRLTALPPLSLYLHIPWCVRKCPYCDFNSHEARGAIPETEYVDAVIGDLDAALPSVWGRMVRTVFIGGGTPSLLSPDAIERLLSAVRARVSLDPESEITLEANPGTLEAGKFAALRRAGINRLSIGVQSFNARHLQALGRIHDTEQAVNAIEAAQACFDNINIDLMYALPDQSADEALDDMNKALDFAPQHISAYHLTIEPNTLFHRYPPSLPNDDAAADMQETIESILASRGYVHYETSAFALPGRQSRHNLNYWQFGDYLGIGAGAHSKISFPERVVREMRYKQPREYLRSAPDGAPIQTSTTVNASELPFEFMMNALRLIDGVERRLFEERTGLPIAVIAARLERAVQAGLLADNHERLQPTLKGQRFLNDLLELFLERP